MKIHVLKFDKVDTTMRLADEFPSFDEYANPVLAPNQKFKKKSSKSKAKEPKANAIAFQALNQTMGRG